MKEVKYPYDDINQTFYDKWYPTDGSTRDTALLGLSSDYGVFAHYYGIPCADMSFSGFSPTYWPRPRERSEQPGTKGKRRSGWE